MSRLIIGGIYKHYKGNNYKVLHKAKSSETLKEYVVYEQLYGTRDIWIRPINEFDGFIIKDKDNYYIPRFVFMGR